VAVRVGVPRALWYYDYFPLFRRFFADLGAEVIVSRPTTRRILDAGVKVAIDETCLPVKVFYGHVAELRDSGVDYVFVPRVVSVEQKTYTCPKFLGLPELIRHGMESVPPVISPTINLSLKKKHLYQRVHEVGRLFTRSSWKIRRAFSRAVGDLKEYRRLLLEGVDALRAMKLAGGDSGGAAVARVDAPPGRVGEGAEEAGGESRLNLVVLGHPYLIYDRLVSLDVLRKLRRLGARVVTVDMVEDRIIHEETEKLPKRLFWSAAKRVMGTALQAIPREDVDGIVHLVSFGCGSDALITELIERFCKRSGRMPFMLLTLDEHSGEAGVVTRLEAFVDMVRRRKAG